MTNNKIGLIVIVVGLFASVSAFSASALSSNASKNSVIKATDVALQCFSEPWNKSALLRLKNDKFEVEDAQRKTALAKQLLFCLASSDPQFRDGIAFKALSQWLRADSFSPSVYQAMFTSLINILKGEVIDELGVYQPFVALVLSEVVRVDRVSPYLDNEQRQEVVDVISDYYRSIKDYRGFDENIGWRHSVAHSADVMLQLALNPKINKAQLDKMLHVLAKQINADGEHFYIYGEPKRIAMAVVYILLRKQHSVAEWENWLMDVSSHQPLSGWGDAYQSQLGLAKLHNTQRFLTVFYALIKASKNQTLIDLVPALEQALKRVN